MRLISLQQSICTYPDEPTLSEFTQAKEIMEIISSGINNLNNFIEKDLNAFNQFLATAGLTPINKPDLIK
jgi:hypothetical protein